MDEIRSKARAQRNLALTVAMLKRMDTALLKCEVELSAATQTHRQIFTLKNPAATKLAMATAKSTMDEAHKELNESKNRDDTKNATEQQMAEADFLLQHAEAAERAVKEWTEKRRG